MPAESFEQPPLPIGIRPIRFVRWCNVEMVSERKLLRTKTVAKFIFKDRFLPSETTIKVDDIADLEDENLRYALRFADAAATAGRIDYGTSIGWDFVRVLATDEGNASRFVSADYSGVVSESGDTFIENLLRARSDDTISG